MLVYKKHFTHHFFSNFYNFYVQKINIHKLIKKKIRKGIDIRKINQEEIKKDRQIVGELLHLD